MVHSYWDFDPSVIGGTAILVLGYAVYVGPLRSRFRLGPPAPLLRQLAFYFGCLVMLLALISPLDGLGDEYLLSAHMAQHMLLAFVAPPLWLVGAPAWLVKLILPRGLPERLANPIFAFLAFNGVFWLWHLPRFYDAALANDYLHVVEHIMFMAGGVLGWAPLIGSGFADEQPLSTKLIYLVPSLFSCNALAALITLSQKPLYSFYGQAALHFGLTTIEDQYIAGLCMWLPGDMLYLAFFLWTVKSMFDDKQPDWKVTG